LEAVVGVLDFLVGKIGPQVLKGDFIRKPGKKIPGSLKTRTIICYS